jgi:hypothetical protein
MSTTTKTLARTSSEWGIRMKQNLMWIENRLGSEASRSEASFVRISDTDRICGSRALHSARNVAHRYQPGRRAVGHPHRGVRPAGSGSRAARPTRWQTHPAGDPLHPHMVCISRAGKKTQPHEQRITRRPQLVSQSGEEGRDSTIELASWDRRRPGTRSRKNWIRHHIDIISTSYHTASVSVT